MKKYFCDRCGELIEDRRIHLTIKVEDRGSSFSIHNYHGVDLCKYCYEEFGNELSLNNFKP